MFLYLPGRSSFQKPLASQFRQGSLDHRLAVVPNRHATSKPATEKYFGFICFVSRGVRLRSASKGPCSEGLRRVDAKHLKCAIRLFSLIALHLRNAPVDARSRHFFFFSAAAGLPCSRDAAIFPGETFPSRLWSVRKGRHTISGPGRSDSLACRGHRRRCAGARVAAAARL